LNISGLASIPYVDNTQQPKTSSAIGSTFTQVVEQLRNAETLMYLEKYTEIYNRYAARYGNGFELMNNEIVFGDMGEAQLRYSEIRASFHNDLAEAGIPGYHKLLTVNDIPPGGFTEDMFLVPAEIAAKKNETYISPIAALFYAEKHGLAGLSSEQMIKQILGGLKLSTAEEMRTAAQLLYNVGAISASVRDNLSSYVLDYAMAGLKNTATTAERIAAMNAPRLWIDMLPILKDYPGGQELYELLSKAWEEAEGESLNAIMHRVDKQQEDIREAIELSNKKRIERELLNKADAESVRLRVLFGLDNDINSVRLLNNSTTAADIL
jgi:hypothetical protein